MEISLSDIDDILSDLERLHQPDYAKVDRDYLKRAMRHFLIAPGMMLPITARHMMIECKRCGECCRYCSPISLDEEECRAIAGYLGQRDQAFTERYIDVLHNSREDGFAGADLVIRKEPGMHCPFYDAMRGCSIYEVRPAACRIFPYLQEDVIDESVNNRRMVCFSNCPAAVELDEKIRALSLGLRSNAKVYIYAKSRVEDLDGMLIYILNVFLRGMENSEGPDVARLWLGNLGMDRLAINEELYRLSLLVCAVLVDFQS